MPTAYWHEAGANLAGTGFPAMVAGSDCAVAKLELEDAQAQSTVPMAPATRGLPPIEGVKVT